MTTLPPSPAQSRRKNGGVLKFTSPHLAESRVGVQICDFRHVNAREGSFMRAYAHGAVYGVLASLRGNLSACVVIVCSYTVRAIVFCV